jgi:hypothetical protein
MAKTYIAKKSIFKGEEVIYTPGQAVPKNEAAKYDDSVKLVETRFPTSPHSFDFGEAEVAEQEAVLDEVYNRKGKKSKK